MGLWSHVPTYIHLASNNWVGFVPEASLKALKAIAKHLRSRGPATQPDKMSMPVRICHKHRKAGKSDTGFETAALITEDDAHDIYLRTPGRPDKTEQTRGSFGHVKGLQKPSDGGGVTYAGKFYGVDFCAANPPTETALADIQTALLQAFKKGDTTTPACLSCKCSDTACAAGKSREKWRGLVNSMRAGHRLRTVHEALVYQSEKPGRIKIALVMDAVPGDDLYVHLNDQLAETAIHPFDDFQNLIDYMLKAVQKLQEWHAHGVVHGDLKPENIVGEEAGEVGLVDGDYAVTENENGLYPFALSGTFKHIAPEIAALALGERKLLEKDAARKVDVYSMTATFVQMLQVYNDRKGYWEFDEDALGGDSVRSMDEKGALLMADIMGINHPVLKVHLTTLVRTGLASRPENRLTLDALYLGLLKAKQLYQFEAFYDQYHRIKDFTVDIYHSIRYWIEYWFACLRAAQGPFNRAQTLQDLMDNWESALSIKPRAVDGAVHDTQLIASIVAHGPAKAKALLEAWSAHRKGDLSALPPSDLAYVYQPAAALEDTKEGLSRISKRN